MDKVTRPIKWIVVTFALLICPKSTFQAALFFTIVFVFPSIDFTFSYCFFRQLAWAASGHILLSLYFCHCWFVLVIYDLSFTSTKTKYIKLNTKTQIFFNNIRLLYTLLFSCCPCQRASLSKCIKKSSNFHLNNKK